MNLGYIINNVDKSLGGVDGLENLCNYGDLFNDAQYRDIPYDLDSKLTYYWFGSWYCTDTTVGYRVYFYEDTAVAVSIQRGRKCDEEVYWVKEEYAYMVKDYIESVLPKEELSLSLCDLEDEMGNSYRIDFCSNLVGENFKTVFYNGEEVEFLGERAKDKKGVDHYINDEITIKYNGELLDVTMEDVRFPYFVK